LALTAPASAEELWRDYGAYMRRLIRRGGVPDQEADDVLGNIVARLIERDVLGMYEPGRTAVYGGREIKVTFKAFLSSIVMQYVKGQRDKLGRLTARELLIADRPQDEAGTTWAELFGWQWFDDYSHLDAQQFINRMRAYLAMVPPSETVGLLELFDELVREVQDAGEMTVKAVREHFGIPAAEAKARIGELRSAIESAPEAPLPSWDVHGVTLGPLEVHGAIRALEEAKGIMVAQPLQRAGHPLKDAPKGWYHQFSDGELELYPELKIDPQTHKKPAGHVKLAVLHRLRRMLAEATANLGSPVLGPASAPAQALQSSKDSATASTGTAAEPDSPRDLIEAELFKLGASPGKVDYILELAAQLVSVPA
jgi:hypothetical protein